VLKTTDLITTEAEKGDELFNLHIRQISKTTDARCTQNIHKLIQNVLKEFCDVFQEESPDGRSLHMCLNYRTLNSYTVKNEAGLPRSDEIFDQIKGTKVFSKLDLVPGITKLGSMRMILRNRDTVIDTLNFK